MRSPSLPLLIVLAALCVAASGARAANAANAANAADADAADVAAAESRIEDLTDGLLDIMKRAEELGVAGRASVITPVVESCFDLEYMARATIGRVWYGISVDDQRRWVEVFTANTVYRLATRFGGFSGQSFEILGHKAASRGTLIVKTNLVRPAQETVRLDYRMHETGSGWKVVDIYARGTISEVAVRRSEYEKMLRESGIDVLIESVAAMTQERLAKDR